MRPNVTIVRSEQPAPVEYTYAPAPVEGPSLPPGGPHGVARQRRADARLRRAYRNAWCDPERSRKDLVAAGNEYAELRDAQGMANAFIAHAETRLADAHHNGYGASLGLSAALTAREEFEYASQLFASLLNQQPRRYAAQRGHGIQSAVVGQRMRPFPLSLTAEDARPAEIGGGAMSGI